jgi:hypothetical protein
MAPITVKERDRETGEETGETRTYFRTAFVFFQEQVVPLPSGEPVALEPPREPLTGDSHGHLLPRLQSFCESLGYSVSFEELRLAVVFGHVASSMWWAALRPPTARLPATLGRPRAQPHHERS